MKYAALELAAAGWPVFPCDGKIPMTRNGHRRDHRPRAGRHLVDQVPEANIGARVPDVLVVIDVDPRNGGDESLEALQATHGQLPATLTSMTGGGGSHLFYLRPSGQLANGAHKMGPGLDVKLGGKGYIILPPSVHSSGMRYAWVDPKAPAVTMPAWMARMLGPHRGWPPPTPEPSASTATSVLVTSSSSR